MGWSTTTTEQRSSGHFIVIEGIEGSGKTTQVRRLSAWLDRASMPHVATREPGGTEVGEAIRSVVLDRPELDIPPTSELFLILAARAAFVRDVVRPALAQGKTVIADRYELSTMAYQGFGRGLDLDFVRAANAVATGGLEPDLCVVLDVHVHVGLDRQRSQGKEADRLESEGAAFLARVRKGYQEAGRADGAIVSIDAHGTVESVEEAVRGAILDRFPETFADLAEYQ